MRVNKKSKIIKKGLKKDDKRVGNGHGKIAVGLSGGVDSSIAAYLLQKQGYDVTGVFIQCWDAKADGCRSDEDRVDAVKVATELGIKFIFLDFTNEYKDKVIEYFYDEYKAGRTPNPDVMCNKEIKFGLFYEWAVSNGFNFVATGHYAGVGLNALGESTLLKGKDVGKDQSYFLYLLTHEKLKKIKFPLWEIQKSEVRSIAKNLGLDTYNKPDSVGICFIGEVNIKEFLKKRIKLHEGAVVNKKGDVLGVHDGVEFYTIGQRHGFKINKYVGLPLYVVGKNVTTNELIVGFMKDVTQDEFFVESLHFISAVTPKFPLKCEVRIRHLGQMYACVVHKVSNTRLKVVLNDPIFGVAPGQSAVFYLKDVVLGGGVIAR